ncbi:MAG: double-strand break repair helicase AddA [Alphaproteobacteria bacterium]|nr:double-strand break repair helicase AddA [Alphaproteobacteria bacterium]
MTDKSAPQTTHTPTTHTAAQITAADPNQSVWVSANAGTGKTHVLIERILRLLLSGTPPRKILCLTFTKAAAAEVANRLSERLGHWAAMDEAALAKNLQELLGKPASEQETATARALFAATLESPEGLRIRTVHSFSESLLGRFPVEARLAPHFSVIDERRSAEIRTEARDRILVHERARSARVSDALSHLAGLVDEERFAHLMRELDGQRVRLRHLMESPDGVDRMIARTRRALGLGETDTTGSVLAAASDNGAFDEKALKTAVSALQDGTQSDQDRAATIGAWLAMETARRADTFRDTYASVFVTQAGKPRAESNLITKKPKEANPDALAALLQEQDRVTAVLDRLKAVAMAEATQSLLVVGTALIGAYESIKTTRALLDYDDLIEKAQGLLATDAGVSWVHYKLDGGIDHILVDEAQDTSPAQWDIISKLAGDFFTGLGAGENERPNPRTVFAVGDEKQSIYSFQGADPVRFGLMRNHFQDQEAAIGRRLPTVELEASYRTTSAVLNVVDAVFAGADAADGLTWDGKAVHHHTNRQGQGGLVELWEPLTPDDAPDTSPWDAPFDKMSAESPPVRLAEKIAAQIAGWLADKEPLASAGRPIRPGDIMILMRTRGAFAEEMVRALKRKNVPVTGRDRLVLTDHLAVMDLIAAGRFALLPDDDLNTAVVLKGPFVEFDDDALFDLAFARKKALWQTLSDRKGERPDFTRAWETLSGLLARADFTPPFEFYSRLLIDGGRRDLLAHLGPEAGEPIDEFLSLALDFERDHESSLEGFLYWVERGETEVKREMERGRNEVRVLTVHGAKGLEAGVVFLPDTCTLPSKTLDPRTHWQDDETGSQGGDAGFFLWRTSKDEEEPLSKHLHEDARLTIEQEYRRLLYVAMTRARDRLYICGWETKNGRTEGCWYDLIAPAVQDLGQELQGATGETLWRLETPQSAEPDSRKAKEEETRTDETLPSWALSPPIAEPEPARPLAPSRPSGDEPPVISPLEEDDAMRFQRGLLVHRLLQSLPDLAPEDRKAAGAAFLGRPSLDLTAAKQDDILTETLAVMDHPDHAALFGPGSLAEVPITGVLGTGTVLSGQIDRLLVTEDTVTVIDFKTNRPPPETESGVSPVYLRQLAAYRELLKGVYPDRPVRALLLWTLGARIMPISDEILDAHAP